MKRPSDRSAITVATITIALILISGLSLIFKREESFTPPRHLRCAIELREHDDTTRGLLTGYNYHLLKAYADSLGSTLEISISRRWDSYLDSLKSGAIDLLVLPYVDSVRTDTLLSSIPVDGISVWLLPTGNEGLLKNLNEWIDRYQNSEEHIPTKNKFLITYDPLTRARAGKKSDVLSPYDDIIRHYADSLNWDWRMLAAIIFQESYFKIEARSHRGALGLMQVMPQTASRLEISDIIDPEENIKAGTTYLGRLFNRYSGVAANREEQLKITLGAYNAGVGRMKDLLGYASLKGIKSGVWEDIITVIPDMNDSTLMSTVDTVKLGVFKGVETISYVERISELYDAFCKICPSE